jgi:hypothetical protein
MALALGLALGWTYPVSACGGGDVAGGLLVLGGGGLLTTATVYDVIKIANDQRPSEFWMFSQGMIAPPLAFAFAYEAADGQEVHALEMFFAGWFAALGGFALGSLGVDRQRAGGVGAAMGLTAASVEHATLSLLGHRPTGGGFVVQTLFAAPGVAAGLNWASDSKSTADVAGGLTLAGVASISLLHGVASHAVGRPEPAMKAGTRQRPRLALGCTPSVGRACTASVSGTW